MGNSLISQDRISNFAQSSLLSEEMSAPNPIPPIEEKVCQQIIEKFYHPGTFEFIHKKCKDIFPVLYDGVKIAVNKGLSPNFQVSHTFNMVNSLPFGYRFGSTYVGTSQITPTQTFPILMGEMDASGNLNANVLHYLMPNWSVKFGAQIINSEWKNALLSSDYFGDNYSVSLAALNGSLFELSGVYIAHYLQKITNNLDLGAELAHQAGIDVPPQLKSQVSIGGRIHNDTASLSFTFNSLSAHMCYFHKTGENIKAGIEVETNLMSGQSNCVIGYQIDLPFTNTIFRGMLSSNMMLGLFVQKKLLPIPFIFEMCITLDHQMNKCHLGTSFLFG